MFLIFVSLIGFYGTVFMHSVPEGKSVVNILLLGGNGLLGSATVQSLLSQDNIKYNITLLNRGNWYWDTEKLIKPFVNHIECSRENGFRETCLQLADDTFYEAIVDFSAYDPLDIEDILIVLEGRFKRYIYISSDSVYEVSNMKNHEGYSTERDAVRPDDESVRHGYNAQDSYGDLKLQGEEVLQKYHDSLEYDYITLRLPDVLGPRDNTKRFWKYYMWAKLHQIIGPVHIPLRLHEKPIRFVYSQDVGKLIAELVHPNRHSQTVFNQAYNLGFKETITLKHFIESMGNFINKDLIEFDESEAANLNFGFPSVRRGPTDISKAFQQLNWSPTNIYKALNETCEFYKEAQYNKDFKFLLDRVLDVLNVRGEKYRDFLELHHDDINTREEL